MVCMRRDTDTWGVRADAPRLRPVVSTLLGGVLIADAFGAAVVAGRNDPRPTLPVAVGAPAAAAPRTLAVITRQNGTKVLADPATPQGRQAIAAARDAGDTVTTVTVQDKDNGDTAARKAADNTLSSLLSLPTVPGVTLPDLTLPAVTLPVTLPVTVPTLPPVVSTLTSTASSVVDTASSIVSSATTAVPPATTIVPTVSSIVATASSLVNGVATTLPPAPVPTTAPPVATTICALVHC